MRVLSIPRVFCSAPTPARSHRLGTHGGSTDESNLALACLPCNRYKGPNVGSYDPVSGALVPFFNPRTQEWSEHFAWGGALIRPLTAEARVTVRILRLNDPDRVADRERLMRLGAFWRPPIG